MAIEDYYRTLTIIEKTENPNGIGGRIRSWSTVTTVQGAISQETQNKIVQGKVIERTVYTGFSEITSYITKNVRLQDTDGKIYRVKGTPNNIENQNHHLEFECLYHDEDNE